MFDNKKYIEPIKEIAKKKKELLDEEYCLLRHWQINLDFYLKDADYILINNCMWVKINKIESGTIKLGKNHSNKYKTPSWYRIDGLVVFDDDTDEINRTFAPGISINVTDTIKKIDEEAFNQALQERSSKVFADTEKNFKIQYYHYHSRFNDYVLEKYPDLFPQQVHDFVNRLEAKLDEELNSKEDW
jgi:hypothetical protein